LKEEKQKLNQYRESVRKHYAELCAGTREGLPTDLARPLSVGQRVIAIHPKTREIHDGSVLTVDYSRCRVQFDRPELGVEFVMVIMFSCVVYFYIILFVHLRIETAVDLYNFIWAFSSTSAKDSQLKQLFKLHVRITKPLFPTRFVNFRR